jgi:hypothetical protein
MVEAIEHPANFENKDEAGAAFQNLSALFLALDTDEEQG